MAAIRKVNNTCQTQEHNQWREVGGVKNRSINLQKLSTDKDGGRRPADEPAAAPRPRLNLHKPSAGSLKCVGISLGSGPGLRRRISTLQTHTDRHTHRTSSPCFQIKVRYKHQICLLAPSGFGKDGVTGERRGRGFAVKDVCRR